MADAEAEIIKDLRREALRLMVGLPDSTDPEGLCVEENGECQCDPCHCQNGDVARPGW